MIRIIIVGKLREKYAIEALAEYSKRISKYSKLEIISVKNEEDIEQKKSGSLFLLDEHGKQLGSREFCNLLKERNITFCIGPSDGFSKDFLKDKIKISLSSMTLMHQLAFVVLLEQIYRGFTILNNEPYHRG